MWCLIQCGVWEGNRPGIQFCFLLIYLPTLLKYWYCYSCPRAYNVPVYNLRHKHFCLCLCSQLYSTYQPISHSPSSTPSTSKAAGLPGSHMFFPMVHLCPGHSHHMAGCYPSTPVLDPTISRKSWIIFSFFPYHHSKHVPGVKSSGIETSDIESATYSPYHHPDIWGDRHDDHKYYVPHILNELSHIILKISLLYHWSYCLCLRNEVTGLGV